MKPTAIGLCLLIALGAAPNAEAETSRPPSPAAGVECPAPGEQARAAGSEAGQSTSGTAGAGAPVPIERSGILPSAGSETPSAPPNIQRNGEPVASAIDCPMGPSHPNAPSPGAAAADMPEQTKPDPSNNDPAKPAPPR